MGKRLLSEKQRLILSSRGKWRIISTLFKPDCAPIKNNAHAEWLAGHTDSHTTREILAVLEGKSLNSLNEETYSAIPGTIFLFDSYEKHDRLYSPETKDSIHLWIFFLKSHTIARIHHIRNGSIRNTEKVEMTFEEDIHRNFFCTGWDNVKKSCLPPELKKKKILAMLELLFLEMIEQDISGKAAEPNDENHQIKVIRAIHQHISNSSGKAMTVEGLARIAGYSKFHFFRLFKKYTGQNVHDCINKHRLKKVAEMLKAGFLQKQIASELGFSCPSAFSNWYSRYKK